ncbi:amidase signature domain-containing protein [Ilyonectria sp. MPI-CAGE-AT-0026]|nr:amidase signature domain-containing protein [Ilyonectria sp. MPI-CAGE-AT-0026]
MVYSPDGKADYKEIVSSARAKRDTSLAKVKPKLQGIPDKLPLNCQGLPKAILTPRKIEITENYSFTELLALLQERKIIVEEVTRAFLRRAALAQAATNCLVDLMWDEAIARAQHLDSLPEPKGLLYSLPISTKEHHGMVGENITTHALFVTWIGKAYGSNLLYDTLYNEGCIFYARTTQLQTIIHLETNSVIYRRTVNLYNRNLTSGGSSGGESALLGIRRSILGVSSNIGSSICCPVAYISIYSFKPTLKHISVMGGRAPMAGKASTPGPITWDGVVQPHPPMTRALKEVAAACWKVGMEVVDWDCEPLFHDKAWEIVSALYWPDGGQETLQLMEASGEPLCTRRDDYRAVYARAWINTGNQDGREVDVILCPLSFGAATPYDQLRYWGYTAYWNLLDYPAAVFPVTTVDPNKDPKDTSYVLKNAQDKFIYKIYSPEKYTDAPVSLQIVGRRQYNEKVLTVLTEIEYTLGRK